MTEHSLPVQPLRVALQGVSPIPDYVWRGFIAKGAITVCASPPKTGKSTTIFGLLNALENGTPFLGLETVTTTALLLSEEPLDALKEKYDRWPLVQANVLLSHQAHGKDWPTIVKEAVDACNEHGLGLLVIDTWTTWAGLRGDTENHSGAVTQALEPLRRAAASGLAILVVTHTRKSGGENGEGVRGSNAFVGGADVIMEMARPRGVVASTTTRTFKTQSRFSSTPAELVFELTADGFVTHGTTSEAKATSEKQRLFDTLAELVSSRLEGDGDETNPTVEEIVLAAPGKISKGVAHKHLGDMLAAGKVGRTGTGRRGSPYRYELVSSQSKTKRDESNTRTEARDQEAA